MNPAESYEHYVVPALFAPWAQDLVGRVPPRAGDRVVDVACGTAVVARVAARAPEKPAAVAGVDPNPAMLEVARVAAAGEGVEVAFHEGRAEELPLPGEAFDVVFCQQGAQFFTDREAGLREMARVLDRGGRVALSTWQPLEKHEFFHTLHGSVQRHLGSPAASAPFGLSEPAEIASLLTAAGLEDVEVVQASRTARYPEPDRFLAETLNALMAVVVSMLDIEEAELRAGVEAVTADMQEPLQALTEDGHVLLPWHANVATGRR